MTSPRNRFAILSRDGFQCVYCGRTAQQAKLHVDHVVPVSAGGPTHWSNLVTACLDCNLGKSALRSELPRGVVLTEPVDWHGSRSEPRVRRWAGPATPDEPGRREPLQSGSLGFCVDACEECADWARVGLHPQARESGCYACLPMSLRVGPKGSGFVMGYRCADGHEWQTAWDRMTAFGHSTRSRSQIEAAGYPYFPTSADVYQ